MENNFNIYVKYIWYLCKYLSLYVKKKNEQIFSGKYLKICMENNFNIYVKYIETFEII